MKYYLVAGEASGDLHGSNLIKEIKKQDNNAEFRFFGGDLMEETSKGNLVVHYKKLSFMGFWEVIKNIRTIFKFIKICKQDIKNYSPDILILIDYPGFNFKILKYAKEILKINKVYYYISPQLWAWKEGRIKTIKRYVDKLFSILPFEEKWFKDRDFNNIVYVGNPLLDALENRHKIDKINFLKENNLTNKPIVAILPGSRKQEISNILPTMLSLVNKYKEYQFVLAKAKSTDISFYEKMIKGYNIKVVDNKTYDLLENSEVALVASGTATLETALIGIPQVVCYKGGEISYQIAKKLVKNIKYISLVNLIMDKEIVKELIQKEFNSKNLALEFDKIITGYKRDYILKNYKELKLKLKSKASKTIANIICKNTN